MLRDCRAADGEGSCELVDGHGAVSQSLEDDHAGVVTEGIEAGL